MSNNMSIGSMAPATRKTYKVIYNTVDLGLCDTVDPSKFKMNFDPIMTGSTGGKNKLGDRFVGIDGVVSVQLRQLSVTQYRALCPWAAGTGAITLTPPLNTDMYSYSALLSLHPVEMGTDTTEDIHFTNAVPVTLPLPKRDGKADDMLDVDFAIYPNRDAMNTGLSNISSGSILGA